MLLNTEHGIGVYIYGFVRCAIDCVTVNKMAELISAESNFPGTRMRTEKNECYTSALANGSESVTEDQGAEPL